MRKEFEENEELRKTLENNLETQDEIDDETFRKILEEEFIEREKQIEEALFADKDFEDLELTDEEVQDSYQELMQRFEKEKRAEFSRELAPDERLVRKVLDGKSGNSDTYRDENKKVLPMEKVRERRKKTAESREHEDPYSKITEITERKTSNRLHRLGKVVGMAVVAVACVFAASMTSEANRKYLVNSVRIWSGDDTKTVNYNDNSNDDSNPDEDKAIADIEEKLEIKVPEFYYRPYGFEFLNYTIDSPASFAWLEYEYQGNCIVLLIDKQSDDKASRIRSARGDEKETVTLNEGDVTVGIKQIYDNNDNMSSYSAEWNYNGVVYSLFGKIELQEIEEIVKNMKF